MNHFIEKVIEHEIETINDHLPKSQIPLSELIGVKNPGYLTRSGDTSVIDPKEITFLANEIPSSFHTGILLPIVILRRIDLGPGVFSASGTKPVLFFLHRLIGQFELEWSELPLWRAAEIFARPQVQIIRRKLPTTTCIGFATSSYIKTNLIG